MNDRPPVYDPNSRKPMGIVTKIFLGIALIGVLGFAGMTILMMIALRDFGSDK